jgi:hypothetical protein
MIGQTDATQSTNRQQRRHEYWRRHIALCLRLDVRSERDEVSSFILDPASALLTPHHVFQVPKGAIETCLIALLPDRSADYGPDQGIVHFEGPHSPLEAPL